MLRKNFLRKSRLVPLPFHFPIRDTIAVMSPTVKIQNIRSAYHAASSQEINYLSSCWKGTNSTGVFVCGAIHLLLTWIHFLPNEQTEFITPYICQQQKTKAQGANATGAKVKSSKHKQKYKIALTRGFVYGVSRICRFYSRRLPSCEQREHQLACSKRWRKAAQQLIIFLA